MNAESIRIASLCAKDYFAPGMDYDDWRQEALIAAWNAEQTFNGSGSIRNWTYMVVRARLRDIVRAATARKRPPQFAELHEIHPARDECSAGEVVEAMRELCPADSRVLIGLAAGLSYPELMEQEGVSYKAIDNRLYKARLKLRERLAA